MSQNIYIEYKQKKLLITIDSHNLTIYLDICEIKRNSRYYKFQQNKVTAGKSARKEIWKTAGKSPTIPAGFRKETLK